MKYVIFSFESGDYLCNEEDRILVFDTLGLAFQYLQENYYHPVPVYKTKRFMNYPDAYTAPFKFQQVC